MHAALESLVERLVDLESCLDASGHGSRCSFARSHTVERYSVERAEATRDPIETAEHLRRAALEQDDEKLMTEAERVPAIRAAADAYRRARAESRALSPVSFVPAPTVVTPELARVSAACKERGIRLVVLLLPVDVMVARSEWKKYGLDPETQPDLAMAGSFATAIEESARSLGAEVLDVTPRLRASMPGMFLNADIHLTPRGHAVVAEGLAELLNEAPERARADPAPSDPGPRLGIERAAVKASAAMVACNRAYSSLDPDCERTYATCEGLRACLDGNALAPPLCRPGFVNLGDGARCFPRCAPGGGGCADGATCVAWRGVHGCIEITARYEESPR
jgi:hypothetical protein